MRVAIIGTGYISADYARTLTSRGGQIVACYDTDADRGRAFAERWGSHLLNELDELPEHDVDVAVNLTPPIRHARVSGALLELNVPVYSEKPLAHELTVGLALAGVSDERGVPLGCAPDTVLGGLQQQLRRAVDGGFIGRPLFMSGHIAWPGHETWHPRPAFFFQEGGGPLLDLGPYWITAMVNLVGPATSVSAVQSPLTIERTLTPRVPMTVAVLIEFCSGVVGSLVLSFDLPCVAAPAFEIVGEEGSLVCATPMFDDFGVLEHRTAADKEWKPLPQPPPAARWQRGMGIAEMLASRRNGSVPRLDKALALHVLDIMDAASKSMATGERVEVTTRCERPAPMEVEVA